MTFSEREVTCLLAVAVPLSGTLVCPGSSGTHALLCQVSSLCVVAQSQTPIQPTTYEVQNRRDLTPWSSIGLPRGASPGLRDGTAYSDAPHSQSLHLPTGAQRLDAFCPQPVGMRGQLGDVPAAAPPCLLAGRLHCIPLRVLCGHCCHVGSRSLTNL